MSGHKRTSEDVDLMAHPDDNTLLTCTGQPFPVPAQSNVYLHIALCERCQLRYGELKRATDLLTETLAHFEDKQYYPPLQESSWNPAAVRLALQQRRQERLRENLALGRALLGRAFGGGKTAVMYPLLPGRSHLQSKQKQPRNMAMASVPVVAIPAVIFLMLLAVFVVLAANSGKLPQYTPVITTSTSYAQHVQTIESHPTATPTVKSVKVLPVYPVTTVTATPGSPKLAINLCSLPADKAQWRIRFCGSNFTAGDQVQLLVYIAGGQSKLRRPVLVSAQGTFQDSWIVFDCKLVPFAVQAEDVTPGHLSEVSQILRNIQFMNCVIPTPTPMVIKVRTKH